MNTRTAFALGACLSLASLGVYAQVEGDVEASGNSYVGAGGMVLKTGLSECLHTGSYSGDSIINVCEGISDDVEEAAADATTEAAEAPAPAPVQKSTIDTRQFSEKTLFDTASAQLTDAGDAAMSSMFGALAEYKGITGISVTGHTDSRGAEEYNQALSEQRAQTVADVISAKYPDAKIAIQGLGESSPSSSNDTAEGRQLNRRVEIEVTATRMIFN